VTRWRHLYLHVEMNDVLGMNKLDSLANLSHDADARFLRQQKVFADRSIEQLTAVYTTQTTATIIDLITEITQTKPNHYISRPS